MSNLPAFTRAHRKILNLSTRVGPVDFRSGNIDASLEMGIYIDHTRHGNSPTSRAPDPQLKWAVLLSETLSVGAVVAAT